MENRLEELLSDHQIGHSRFQIDNFIVAQNGATLYGRYKQALTELYSRFNLLKAMMCDKVENDLRERELVERKDDGVRGRIEYVRFMLQREEEDRQLDGAKREFGRFYQHACAMRDRLVEQNGELTAETKERLERELWETKFKKEAAAQLVTTGRVDGSVYEAVRSLPPPSRDDVLRHMGDPQALVDWSMRHDNECSEVVPKVDQVAPFGFLEEFERKLLEGGKD